MGAAARRGRRLRPSACRRTAVARADQHHQPQPGHPGGRSAPGRLRDRRRRGAAARPSRRGPTCAPRIPGARVFLLGDAQPADLDGVELVGLDDDPEVVLFSGADESYAFTTLNRVYRVLLGGAAFVTMHRTFAWMTTVGSLPRRRRLRGRPRAGAGPGSGGDRQAVARVLRRRARGARPAGRARCHGWRRYRRRCPGRAGCRHQGRARAYRQVPCRRPRAGRRGARPAWSTRSSPCRGCSASDGARARCGARRRRLRPPGGNRSNSPGLKPRTTLTADLHEGKSVGAVLAHLGGELGLKVGRGHVVLDDERIDAARPEERLGLGAPAAGGERIDDHGRGRRHGRKPPSFVSSALQPGIPGGAIVDRSGGPRGA